MTSSRRRVVVLTFGWVLVLVVLYHQRQQTFSPKVRVDDFDLTNINDRISAECSNDKSTPNPNRSQDDPCILEYIDNHFLLPPSTKSYNFTKKNWDHANRYSRMIEKYFNKKNGGTFIEVGAYDGEGSSNSLYFELTYGWTGLLIECNPLLVSKLVSKHRKTWIAQACLSTTDVPETVNLMTLKEWPASAQLNKPLSQEEMNRFGLLRRLRDKQWYNYSLPAFPLYSITMATKAFTEIDFLSLDVQGIELKVLRNFPFEKFNINYIFAEIDLLSETEKREVKDLMESKGYKFLKDHKTDYSFGREL